MGTKCGYGDETRIRTNFKLAIKWNINYRFLKIFTQIIHKVPVNFYPKRHLITQQRHKYTNTEMHRNNYMKYTHRYLCAIAMRDRRRLNVKFVIDIKIIITHIQVKIDGRFL